MEQGLRQEILLASGTNEMEIIEFYLGGQSFGINVQKLKGIIPFDEGRLTKRSGTRRFCSRHAAVAGQQHCAD